MELHFGSLTITSPAFEHGGRMPDDHSANGAKVSPPLTWHGAPAGTESFALICHDPDAPLTHGFTHWVVYNILASAPGLAEGGGAEYTQGVNSVGAPGFTPAAPPSDHGDHFYYFHLYALDTDQDLPAGLSSDELLEQIDSHIIEQARLVGTYSNTSGTM